MTSDIFRTKTTIHIEQYACIVINNFLLKSRPHRWCNAKHALLGCVRLWVRVLLGYTKDYCYKIGICCFPDKLGVIAKTGWLRIGIVCLSGATCLSADCWFSVLAQ